jgi:excisionase family DNA binding protein
LKQAAELLSTSEKTVSRLCDRKELTRIRIGPRGVRISVAELEAWVAKQATEVTT